MEGGDDLAGRRGLRSSPIGISIHYIISISSPVFRGPNLSDIPAISTTNKHSTLTFHLPTFVSISSSFTMSFSNNHNDLEAIESFEAPRIPDQDDFEENRSFASRFTDPGTPSFALHANLGGVQHLPVSLSYLKLRSLSC